MTNQGLTSLFAMEDISVMGIWELLPHLRKFRVSCYTFVPGDFGVYANISSEILFSF